MYVRVCVCDTEIKIFFLIFFFFFFIIWITDFFPSSPSHQLLSEDYYPP